jgi:pyrroline-5-carboxylate reductase
MRIGFIGSGAMASAIAKGVVAKRADADVLVTDINADAADALARSVGGTAVADASALVREVGGAGLVVLAVKPHVIVPVLSSAREALAEVGVPVVSIAAGIAL